jgi:tyrosyl-tRNA synthetase
MAYISPQTGGLSFQEDNIPLQNKKAKDPTASLCSKPPKSQQKAQELLEEESKTLPSPSLSPDSLINLNFNPVPCTLSFQERLKLCLSVGEEIVTEPRLSELLKLKKQFICYDGFEPSGRMHIAQGIYKVINVNRLTKAGGLFIFWIADYFAMLNHKLGGDLEKIKIVGKYFIEIWKAAGMDGEGFFLDLSVF